MPQECQESIMPSIMLHHCSTSCFSRHLGLLIKMVTLNLQHQEISQVLVPEARVHKLMHSTIKYLEPLINQGRMLENAIL